MTKCPLFKFRLIYLGPDVLFPPPVRCCGSCQSWDREKEECRERRTLRSEND